MEHIADVLKKDPLEVREANYLKPGDDLIPAHGVQEAGSKFEGENLAPVLVDEMKKIADYEARKKETEEFNKVSELAQSVIKSSFSLLSVNCNNYRTTAGENEGWQWSP